jgi:DNA polymerase III subunit epsilon
MPSLRDQIFVCLDCETTGLEPRTDRIIEVAAVLFKDGEILDRWETLIDPGVPIPASSSAIHHIMDAMVAGKPAIRDVMQELMGFVEEHPIIGHGIPFDLQVLHHEAKRCEHTSSWDQKPFFDTLRLARLYGESPENSLERLRQHFNIPPEGAHRAMNDVVVNVQVFQHLTRHFRTVEEMQKTLSKPILMRKMPLGKHKGRPFKEVPVNYLQWAAHQDFDEDLLHSIRTELSRRHARPGFQNFGNPFQTLEGL